MKLMNVFRIDSCATREPRVFIPGCNNHRERTRHQRRARDVSSYSFPVNQAGRCWAVSLILILSLCQRSVSGRLKCVTLWFRSVSKRRWLICDLRWGAGKLGTAANDSSWTVSAKCLFEDFFFFLTERFLRMGSWQTEKRIQRHFLKQVLQTAGCSTLQSFVPAVVWTNWRNPSSKEGELSDSH